MDDTGYPHQLEEKGEAIASYPACQDFLNLGHIPLWEK